MKSLVASAPLALVCGVPIAAVAGASPLQVDN